MKSQDGSKNTTDLGVLPWFADSIQAALDAQGSGPQGLSDSEAALRLKREGPNRTSSKNTHSKLKTFLRQFGSPIVLLLIAASVLSGFLGDISDSITILAIVISASTLSFFQEFQADHSIRELLKLIQAKAQVRRDSTVAAIPADQIVRGDVVLLEAGSSVPADGILIESNALLVNESELTGESMPVEKSTANGKEDSVVFAGTHVQSGSGVMVVVNTGSKTTFGSIVQHLQQARPEPEFHRGIRRYGYMLMELTLLLTLVVFAANVWFKKPILESFLFSLALAVGLTPQLLPAIMSLTLSKGARKLAEVKVIVKRLEAIEDFGNMNVLCSDKTGTVTQGKIAVAASRGIDGVACDLPLRYAALNARSQEGFRNPIDDVLAATAPTEEDSGLTVVGTVPYDFFRKRASVLMKDEKGLLLITKGAVEDVLSCCTTAASPDGEEQSIDKARESILTCYRDLSAEGYRVLGVAIRRPESVSVLDVKAESELQCVGLIAFEDPVREDAAEMVASLRKAGVRVLLVTGDNRLIAAHIAHKIGLAGETIATGSDLETMSTRALIKRAAQVDVFAETNPVQKERIILALKGAKKVVGYIGDGINDGAALHAADVGISVSDAADVAREAADLVMLERGLSVILRGIHEGRRIFANTLKYIYITTSANFGNMFSMAASSLFLPFLPLLPKQILLNNFLSDIPAIALAGDSVDAQLLAKPRHWNVQDLRKFMIAFGLQSSIFDLVTFAVLLGPLHAAPAEFRTGWFVESALSELLILLVVRTRLPFFRSRPSGVLLGALIATTFCIVLLPYSPFASFLGFVPLPLPLLGVLSAILALYGLTAEWMKKRYIGLY